VKLAAISSILTLALFISGCEDSKDQTTILSLIDTALKDSEISEDVTLLMVSGADCGNCFVTELARFLNTESLDATLLIGFEGNKSKGLDKKVNHLLAANAVPIFETESLELLVEMGKYSGSPQSPYILRYVNKELQIESLVRY